MLWMLFLYPLLQFGQERINWVSFEQLDSLLAVEPRETLLFIHTDWCGYCRKMEQEIFTNKEIVRRINTKYYAVSFDAESVEDIVFDQSIWKSKGSKKRTGQFHPLAKLLLGDRQLVFPSILRYDNTFNLKKIQQKYLNSKELAVFLK